MYTTDQRIERLEIKVEIVLNLVKAVSYAFAGNKDALEEVGVVTRKLTEELKQV